MCCNNQFELTTKERQLSELLRFALGRLAGWCVQVLSGLPDLEELALGSTKLGGNLTCNIPDSLKV